MKKRIAIVLAMLLMLGTLAGCGSSAPADSAASDGSAASAEGEARVFIHGFDLDYPPYSYLDDNGEIGGFDVELCQAVCEKLGWTYEALPLNWDAKDAELESGNCDVIWSGFTKNGREDDYCWGTVYSENVQKIMVLEGSDVKSLADLAGKKVGVQTATSAYDLLNGDQAELMGTFESLEVYETYTIAVNDLMAGAIDAVAIDVTTGNFQMGNNEGLAYIDEDLGNEQYSYGFRKDDTELCEQVNGALEELVEDGTFAELGEKYPEIKDYLCLGK